MPVLSARCSIVLSALLLSLTTASAEAKVFQVYYLGGQSNMDGYGRNSELPAELKQPVPGVFIFHGNTEKDGAPVDGRGVWSQLKPGHGVGFRSDGSTNTYSDRFGVELTFARRLRELHPDQNVAIVKYSRGGTSIAIEAARHFGCWDPDYNAGEGAGKGINQYDHFLATIRHSLAARDIDGDGEEDTLVPAGICWMQGESDAGSAEVAARYEANLKRLMDLIRAALRADDLPVAIGRISDSGKDDKDGKVWDFGEQVRAAEAAYVEHDGRAGLVTTTDKYGYSDPYHYDSAGYIDLGKQFAETLPLP